MLWPFLLFWLIGNSSSEWNVCRLSHTPWSGWPFLLFLLIGNSSSEWTVCCLSHTPTVVSHTHAHTQTHIPSLIDIAVIPFVCLVGLSHHLWEATPPPPLWHSSYVSLPILFLSYTCVWMPIDFPQYIARYLLLHTYTSWSTSLVRSLPLPPTHR
jgi:hypothetical protein